MTPKYNFRAVIEGAGDGGAFVTIPFDVGKAFGKTQVKVKALIEGVPYRGLLVRMGGPNHILIMLKDIRQQIGKNIGDEVEVELEEDTEPRLLEIPEDLQKALENDPAAQAFFNRLSYTHQKEYVRWIEEARREQTRKERVSRTIDLCKQGKRNIY